MTLPRRTRGPLWLRRLRHHQLVQQWWMPCVALTACLWVLVQLGQLAGLHPPPGVMIRSLLYQRDPRAAELIADHEALYACGEHFFHFPMLVHQPGTYLATRCTKYHLGEMGPVCDATYAATSCQFASSEKAAVAAFETACPDRCTVRLEQPREHASLAGLLQNSPAVCQAASEFACLSQQCGGMGRALTDHAFWLVQNGMLPRILYVDTNELWPTACNSGYDLALMLSVAHIVPMPSKESHSLDGTAPALALHQYLLQNPHLCSILHVPDFLGYGAIVAQARRAGLPVFKHMLVNVVSHGTTRVIDREYALVTELNEVAIMASERIALEHADSVVFLSQEHASEYRKFYNVRGTIAHIPNQHKAPGVSVAPVQFQSIQRVIFYGKFTFRKGLNMFVEAVAALKHDALAGMQIDVIGSVPGSWQHAEQFVAHRVQPLLDTLKPLKVKVHLHLNTAGVIRFMNEAASTSLVVVPSVVEIQPFALLDVLQSGTRFILSDTWAHRSLVEAGHTPVFFHASPMGLEDALVQAMRERTWHMPRAKQLPDPHQLWRQWYDEAFARIDSAQEVRSPSAGISVVVTVCKQRPGIQRALDSIRQQDRGPYLVDIVVVRACVGSRNAHAYKADAGDVRVVDAAVHGDLAAARNAGIQAAKYDLVTFLDDDDALFPGVLLAYLRAKDLNPETGAFVTWVQAFLTQEDGSLKSSTTWITLGGAPEFGGLANLYGAANMAVNLAAAPFQGAAVFTPRPWTGCEDWEVLLRAAYADSILLVPVRGLKYIRPLDGDTMSSAWNTVGSLLRNRCAVRAAEAYSDATNARWAPVYNLYAQHLYYQHEKRPW